MVEHAAVNRRVKGSSPTSGAIFTPQKQGFSKNKSRGKPSQLCVNCVVNVSGGVTNRRINQNKKPATGVFTPANNTIKV